jgi:DNA polymerase-3 subunit delta
METANLFLFTGPNEYALFGELQRWKKGFAAKHGVENLLVIPAKQADLSALLDAVQTMPFIAEKRLVVIEGIPKLEKEECKQLFESIHPQTILAFADAKPDKRLTSVKELMAAAEMKEFPELGGSQLLQWMKAEVHALGATLSDAAARALLVTVGENQQMLATELKKLSSFAFGREITVNDIDVLAVPSGTQVVWQLTDLIGKRKSAEALAFFARQIDKGEDAYGMWAILLNMVKNLTLVVAALAEDIDDERGIASATGMHFLAARGLLPLAKNLDLTKIKPIVEWASTSDRELKTGGYHYTSERQDELIALSEKIILACS